MNAAEYQKPCRNIEIRPLTVPPGGPEVKMCVLVSGLCIFLYEFTSQFSNFYVFSSRFQSGIVLFSCCVNFVNTGRATKLRGFSLKCIKNMKFPPKSFEKYENLLIFARKCYKTLLPTGGEMCVHFSKKLFQIAQKLFQIAQKLFQIA